MADLPTAGTYLENSALDAFLRSPSSFGEGPFVISEFSLAEKTRLPWDEYCASVLGMRRNGVRLLAVPPVTQIITGNLADEWRGRPMSLVELNVEAALAHRRLAQDRLDSLCASLSKSFSERYIVLRELYADWMRKVDDGAAPHLLDPRRTATRRTVVLAATLEKLGRSAPPTVRDPLPERLRWHINAWETALVLTRLDRANDHPKDLKNDPIDALHYTLAATFCERIAVRERDMQRIRELMPEPRLPLLRVDATEDGVVVTLAA